MFNFQHIVAVIDPGLLEDIQEPAEVHEVIRRLDALGVQYRVQPQTTQNAVTWQRVEVKHTVDSDLQVNWSFHRLVLISALITYDQRTICS